MNRRMFLRTAAGLAVAVGAGQVWTPDAEARRPMYQLDRTMLGMGKSPNLLEGEPDRYGDRWWAAFQARYLKPGSPDDYGPVWWSELNDRLPTIEWNIPPRGMLRSGTDVLPYGVPGERGQTRVR